MHEVNHNKNVVEVKDVSYSYGDNKALERVSFAVHKGDYLALVGPNGAGKTTLLKIVLGLLTPSRGSVMLFDEDMRHFKGWSKIGYVPQKVTNFDENFPATVYEVVNMGRYGRKKLFRQINNKDREIVQTALEQVGMWGYKDRLIGDLSGGQQQRVFIARALATEPEIIFLDEPTVGIDQKAKDEFYILLRKLNKELGMTLVLISHDIEMVTREVHHVACIDRELVCYGSPEEFLKDTHSSEILGGKIKVIFHGHDH